MSTENPSGTTADDSSSAVVPDMILGDLDWVRPPPGLGDENELLPKLLALMVGDVVEKLQAEHAAGTLTPDSVPERVADMLAAATAALGTMVWGFGRDDITSREVSQGLMDHLGELFDHLKRGGPTPSSLFVGLAIQVEGLLLKDRLTARYRAANQPN